MDVFARLLLEAENLLERLDKDPLSKRRWIAEFQELASTIEEARDIIWAKERKTTSLPF